MAHYLYRPPQLHLYSATSTMIGRGRGRGVNNNPAWMTQGGGDAMRGGPPDRDDRDPYYGRGPSRDHRGPPPQRDHGPRGDMRGDYHRGPPPRRSPPPRGGGARRGPPRGNRSGIVFRSYEEERDWVEDRRTKRMERKSKWDVLPTPEQTAVDAQAESMQNFAATDFSGDSSLPQQTRHARRLYLGNLPPNVHEQEVHDFFLDALCTTMETPLEEDPILSVYINHERCFAFLEFKSVEMTTAGLQLDGIDINGKGKVHVKRPNDYNPLTAPKIHASKIPILNVGKLGIIGKTVPDGPNKVFVGGLHYHLTEDQVLELLQAFGAVKAFHLVMDPTGTTSKGYGFVEYQDPTITQVAIMGLNGMDLGGGKVLTARVAQAADDTSAQLVAANLIGGYDVEALLDAAMGLRPMPTSAPLLMVPNMPMMGMPPMQQPMMQPSPLEIANQALQSLAAPPPPSSSTRILVLGNMVTDEDLATPEDLNALREEVRQECAKFGTLLSLQIPPTMRKVFLEYASVSDAQAANQELDGRQFGPNVVEVS